MRVNRLHLQGFKSFSGRAELELGPGITAIVGPNGSGKSNLVDAIRMVLGETSARELRGQRLEQVIFAGGAHRAPVGMAEVGIVFDNEDGRLPVEDVEVSIGRRVFRDGTSEFRRNGRRVRLRDLGRLLDATGLAQAGYSVIAQNDIESIIRATPAQRRHLIEEAAGVRGAQALIDDARSRLLSLGDGLDGSVGRLSELLPRIQSLREEAETAEEAARLEERIRRLRGSLERGTWLQALAEQRRLERQLQGAQRRLDLLGQQSQDFLGGYESERDRLRAIESSRIEAERLAGSLALARQQAEAEVARWQERLEQLAQTRSAAEEAGAEAAEDLVALGAPALAPSEVPDSLHQGRDQLASLEQARPQLEGQVGRSRTSLGSLRRDRLELEERLAQGRRRGAELEAERAGADTFLDRADQDEEEAASAAARARSEQETASLARRELQVASARDAAASDRAERVLAAAAGARQRAEEGVSQATVALREAEARLASQAARIEAGRELRPIAQAAASGKARLRRLGERVRAAEAGDAVALDAALGPLLQALVGDEGAVRSALELAGGAAELLCWPLPEQASLANPPEGCRPLADALEGDSQALQVVLRLTRQSCLARDRQAASRWLARFPEGRAVLPDGSVLGAGMEITPDLAEGELRSQERLQEAERTVTRQRAELGRAEERLARAAEAQSQGRSEAESLRRATQASQAAVDAAEREQLRLQEAVIRSAATMEDLRQQLERRRGQSQAVALELTQLGVAQEQLQAALAEASQREAEQERQLAAEEEQLRNSARQLEELRLELASAEAEWRAGARQAAERERRREQLLARQRVAGERVELARSGEEEAREALLAAQLRAQEALSRQERALAQRSGSGEAAEDPLQRLAELERRRAGVDAELAAGRAAVAGAERDLIAQRQRAEQLHLELGPGTEGEDPAEPGDPARTAQELERLRRRLAQLGAINQLAPGQLQELLERTQELRSAHDDCLGAKGELERVLERLQRISEGRFEQTRKAVTKEFEQVWPELFGGGRATLVAAATENGTPVGIELEVQPRGKRPIPMQLLSGGERALTALALVLALQQVSPSPFYVFDEVDASLDQANISQFAKLLQRRAEHCQFLVVTHSLTTMATASLLYGVTQDGEGSSRLLSVRLADGGRSVEADDGVRLETVGSVV